MQFSTLFTAATLLITAVTGAAVQQRDDAVVSDEATHELLRAYKDYEETGLQKRACKWGNCSNCYEKYSFCHQGNPISTINCVKPYLLRPPSVALEHLPEITGFHVPSGSAAASSRITDANREILRWLSAVYRIERERLPQNNDDRGMKAISAAAEALFFRSRLSRMTGLHGPGSENNRN
ncbi:hypothetical protein CEP51_014406 [Fusarium floridanum]|uniref:Uncharacterized protein n=1 Tax=Fusarium floridanum TaxID=1325733 RepID=A0A428PTG0_9HYPO|nr:hypothetical protein CEP51_014406 [Fusarium floridanum]